MKSLSGPIKELSGSHTWAGSSVLAAVVVLMVLVTFNPQLLKLSELGVAGGCALVAYLIRAILGNVR